MNMFKKNGGFTLVELIVVIAILAILAGVAIPAYSGYIEKANEAALITELDAIATAAQAANATKGEITGISVVPSSDGKGVDVTVTADGGFSDTYDSDFVLFYTSATPIKEATDVQGTFDVVSVSLVGQYEDVGNATWANGKWTAKSGT